MFYDVMCNDVHTFKVNVCIHFLYSYFAKKTTVPPPPPASTSAASSTSSTTVTVPVPVPVPDAGSAVVDVIDRVQQ